MSFRAAVSFAVFSAMALSSGAAHAGPTTTWTVDSYKEFDEGEASSALITSMGEVRPGYSTSRIEVPYSDSWSMIDTPSGDLYIGTSDEGAIYAVRSGQPKKLASLPDVVAVVSLALGDDGTLYAGTMPGGQVWKVSPSGQTRKLASLKDTETVWALVWQKGALYAGTGPHGKLYRIDPRSGRSTVVFSSDDKRITALMAASDGSVWLGTSDKALVFRHDPRSKSTRAMADFAGNEITAIAEWNGAAVVAANDLQEPATTGGLKTKSAIDKAKKEPKEGVKIETAKTGTTPGADTAVSGAEPPRKGARKGKGALFRVRGDGQLTQLHALTSTYFTSIVVDDRGRLFAGAGDKGRVYMVEDDDEVSTAFDVPQRVVAQMVYDPQHGVRFATTDSTALYDTSEATKKAEYTSDTFDAEASARYGTIIWRGKGVSIETRTGNTADPDKGWSRWQAPRSRQNGPTGIQRGKVSSPAGRYLQYRVRFSSPSSVLTQTEVYYLAQNRPTTIEKIEIKRGGDSDEKLVVVQDKAKPRSPVLEIDWDVENEDDDETVYDLMVRRDGEARWRRLNAADDPVTKTEYKWNTETFPDGYYRLRITASDRRANPEGARRETHKTTKLFAVDNEKPTVDNLTVRFPAASARARDSVSTVAQAAFSVDDGMWQVAGSADGLFDDQAEILRISLPRTLSGGVHTLAIRVADEAGNVSSTSTSFQVP